MNAISIDWSENTDENGESLFNLECPNYEHHNKYGSGWETKYEAIEDQEGNKCDPYQGCPCCEDDSGYLAPMMNYIYPLDYAGFVEGSEGTKIRIQVASETNCVLVQNTKTDEWFLTLTGGGMDLSPSIAYAYMICQKWLPNELLQELKPGWCKDSLDAKVFKKLRNICIEQTHRQSEVFKEKEHAWKLPISKITQ